ncbi:unnamed protein product [Parajaminaea phylloscopi]
MSKFLRDGVPRKSNGKIDFTPKTHHAHYLLLVILGFLLPPLAVAARFGIGKDFFINCFMTLCGYFPGHGHNFFVQNIRDNRNKNRTPKWAIRYGLVDTNYLRKREKKRQWTGRYNDTLPNRTQYDDDGNEVVYESHHRFEDGDQTNPTRRARTNDASLVDQDRYYNEEQRPSGSSSDPYSLRRSRSNISGAGYADAGEEERTKARSKSRSRAFLGRKKADRHAKTGELMGADRYGDGASMNSSRSGSRYSVEGPEDPDARYRPSGGRSGSGRPSQPSSAPRPSQPADGRRRPNDGLDHTF